MLGVIAAAGLVAMPGRAAPVAVPHNEIPPAVVAQLRALESQFELALAADCAPERCFSKGCSYVAHTVVDKPATTSLPGLGADRGPGSIAAQEYLTQARCEFAHEKTVPARDVQSLVRRLHQKLSQGWLGVTVASEVLLPVPAGLRESPVPPPVPEVAPPPPLPPPAAVEPPHWDASVAQRELWLSLLPHFAWMIAVVLLTLAGLTLIWGARRLGRESVEEKAMLLQLGQGGGALTGEDGTPHGTPPPRILDAASDGLQGDTMAQRTFVEEQRRVWTDKIAGAGFAKDDSAVAGLLREWLKAGEFALLAKAVSVFSHHLTLTFPADGELAQRKLEFADYIKDHDGDLPSDVEFFRVLNQHAISSALLSQADAEVYRSLREEFGSMGVVNVIDKLPPRPAALLFALVPVDCQLEVARLLGAERRARVVEQLLLSNRIARDETAHVFAVLRAATAGQALPALEGEYSGEDRGREFDAAGAISMLLPYLAPGERTALFKQAWQRGSGAFPVWYEGILSADMLAHIPLELQTDLLLEVEMRSLAAWVSIQQPVWQEDFIKRLPASMLQALRGSMAFASRAAQLGLAVRGRQALAAALQKRVGRGQVPFEALLTGVAA